MAINVSRIFRLYIIGLACKVIGHKKQVLNSFKWWESTDIQTGERLESGFKDNKPWIVCLRCGKDFECGK
jgi:hypothetical protein